MSGRSHAGCESGRSGPGAGSGDCLAGLFAANGGTEGFLQKNERRGQESS